MKLTFYVLMVCLLVSCSREKSTTTETLQYTFLKDKNTSHPLIQGVWKSIGNGYYLEVRKDSILLYSYTHNFCYKEKNDYLEGLLNSQSQFKLRQDTLAIYLTDYGDKTQNLQSKKDFIKIDGVPENCIKFSEMTQLNSQELFQLYIETLKENYAFSKTRNLDWNSISKTYRDSISTERQSLFETLGQIATLTKDQHTKVINKEGRSLQYRVTPSAKLVQDEFSKQSEISNLNDYFNLFFNTNYKNISDSLLLGKGKKTANGKLEWGSVTATIGYLNIHSFNGFAPQEFSRKQQIDSLHLAMEQIITSFAEKDAIIIDISLNFGGYDASGLTIASYFTDESKLAYFQEVYTNGHFYQEDHVTIEPATTIQYTKPVYLMMSDISRSSAENFAMMMGALPNVKLVGTRTLGTLSGMLGKSVGDLYTTSSNQRFMTPEGIFYEGVGVPPDIELTIFRKEDIFQSHKMAVQDIVKMISPNRQNE